MPSRWRWSRRSAPATPSWAGSRPESQRSAGTRPGRRRRCRRPPRRAREPVRGGARNRCRGRRAAGARGRKGTGSAPAAAACWRSATASASSTASRSTVPTASRSRSWFARSSPSTRATRNRDRAFARLVERFPTWEAVRDAPLGRGRGGDPARRPRHAEGAADPGGAARPRRGHGPRLAGDRAARGGDRVSHGAPGVGRKTAACIQIFTWGIPEIPVDVHVHRVGGRLGLFRRAPLEEAHDEMLAVTDPADAYELHMNLIRHGRGLPPAAALLRVRPAPDVPVFPRAGRGGRGAER